MKSYKLLYLFWLLPLYLLGLTLHQTAVYYGLQYTYENGESYTSTVTDFNIKQIAAQTNGYVVLKFTPASGETIERKLGIPVQLASQIMETEIIPIRYKKGAFEEIVMMPTYKTHLDLVLMNIGIAVLALLIGLGIAITAHRFASRKLAQKEDDTLNIERVDIQPTT
jgi:hypothetical protein